MILEFSFQYLKLLFRDSEKHLKADEDAAKAGNAARIAALQAEFAERKRQVGTNLLGMIFSSPVIFHRNTIVCIDFCFCFFSRISSCSDCCRILSIIDS
jgi:hypothetical protein